MAETTKQKSVKFNCQALAAGRNYQKGDIESRPPEIVKHWAEHKTCLGGIVICEFTDAKGNIKDPDPLAGLTYKGLIAMSIESIKKVAKLAGATAIITRSFPGAGTAGVL